MTKFGNQHECLQDFLERKVREKRGHNAQFVVFCFSLFVNGTLLTEDRNYLEFAGMRESELGSFDLPHSALCRVSFENVHKFLSVISAIFPLQSHKNGIVGTVLSN